MSETKINVELLEKVKAHILEEPRRFNMGVFAMRDADRFEEMQQRPPCGTVACIAGWAVIEDARSKGRAQLTHAFLSDIGEDEGAEVLGLTFEQANRLFYAGAWPAEFRQPYRDARHDKDFARMAEVACKRIDHFVKTNGAE